MIKIKNQIILISLLIYSTSTEKIKIPSSRSDPMKRKLVKVTTTTTTTEFPNIVEESLTNRTILYKAPNIFKVPDKIDVVLKKKKPTTLMLPVKLVQEWAEDISKEFLKVEDKVVRKQTLMKHFTEMKDIIVETRDGASIVENAAAKLDELLQRRTEAAEAIGRQAEKIAALDRDAPPNYIFDNSIGLDSLKPLPPDPEDYEIPLNCSSLRRVPLKALPHFGKKARVELDISSVKVATEVFDCDPRVLKHVYWSEDLLHVFLQNYAKDAMMDFQYFCSAKGFLRHYPAAAWDSMFNLQLSEEGDEEGPADVYDCRLRPWYVAASGAPRDILVLFDGSGSMENSTNKFNGEQFILTLMTALNDDDHVNVLRFNIEVEYAISCFENRLVPANYVNTAAFMAASQEYTVRNITNTTLVLREGVKILQEERARTDRPEACQQAIVLVTDTIPENYTEILKELDPSGNIRLFVIWLHDVSGLRDASKIYGEGLSCPSDGYFGELLEANDVTEQVMRILRVLERPLVHQKKHRQTVFSDLYAHVEDPRRSGYYWRMKENTEQGYLYSLLKRNKDKFIAGLPAYIEQQELYDQNGYYYEEQVMDYRLQITVSVPVFDDTRLENITIQLAEYPVNRLLGVAGVDIPIEHLKMILPYHQLGAGGSLFIIDHRGNIIIHDNQKPVFDGDILKPGYRAVDMVELEQPAVEYTPRNYPPDWLQFRNEVVIEKPRGSRVMTTKYIFENGMRATLEQREYFWKRVRDHYTVVVSLPKYNKLHAVPEGAFTQQLAAKAHEAFQHDLSVHPDWLYCKHVDQHFEDYEFEVRHFVRRRMDEPNFKMQFLTRRIKPTLLEKTYICNEELMARLCKEVLATEQWADEHQDKDEGRDCYGCLLGSVTAFFASESGLTRWQQYMLTSAYADPPVGREWPRGPSEPWYKRAAASPGTLVVHAPVTPIRKKRNTNVKVPALPTRDIWLTAARTLKHPDKGMLGVTGYHFHPKHLNDILESVTNKPCPADEDDCEPQCDGVNWSCVLIDEGAWIVAGFWREPEDVSPEDPAREHLARLYPRAMQALLDADIFKLRWIHDYQAICFPPENSAVLPTILMSIWRSIAVLLHVTKELVIVASVLTSGRLVAGDTEKELEKRRNSIRRNFEREKWERLYDNRTVLNRTEFAACDRSRPIYELQRTPRALEMLKRKPNNSTWPLIGAVVPDTNLILLAICNVCNFTQKPVPVPNPLNNIKVNMSEPAWNKLAEPALLACWRNRVSLPIRARNTTCYPHVYEDEEGYRQCGPWLPDPEAEELTSNAGKTHQPVLCFMLYCSLLFVLT